VTHWDSAMNHGSRTSSLPGGIREQRVRTHWVRDNVSPTDPTFQRTDCSRCFPRSACERAELAERAVSDLVAGDYPFSTSRATCAAASCR
jgi:hypothetical protein